MRTRSVFLLLLTFGFALLTPRAASADITAFLGVNSTPSNRAVRGLAAGAGMLIVGFEVEYSNTSEDITMLAPSLKTVMFNGIVQTPIPVAGMQLYATAGGGGYQERLNALTIDTNFGMNVGGGAKIPLLGPLRLRVDYRIFTLKGEPLHSKVQRLYAGVNLKF
jgi:hypothetical protein